MHQCVSRAFMSNPRLPFHHPCLEIAIRPFPAGDQEDSGRPVLTNEPPPNRILLCTPPARLIHCGQLM